MEKQKKDVFFALVWKNLFLFWMIFELPVPRRVVLYNIKSIKCNKTQ